VVPLFQVPHRGTAPMESPGGLSRLSPTVNNARFTTPGETHIGSPLGFLLCDPHWGTTL
jgi:hypothetical protein